MCFAVLFDSFGGQELLRSFFSSSFLRGYQLGNLHLLITLCLLNDSIASNSKLHNGEVEAVQNLSDKDFLARHSCKLLDLVLTDYLAFQVTSLEVEVLMGLRKISEDLSGCDNVVSGGDSQRGSTVQVFVPVKAQLLRCKADQGILDDSILNASFTKLLAELGIILNVDALVIDQYASGEFLIFSTRDATTAFFSSRTFAFGIIFTSYEIKVPSRRKDTGGYTENIVTMQYTFPC